MSAAADLRVESWTGSAQAWDEFVGAASDGTIMHLHGWCDAVARAYGHRTFRLAAVEGSKIRGVLPLVLVSSRFLRPSLVSMPYMDYGGACVAGDAAAHEALIAEAQRIADRHHALLTLRYLPQPSIGLPASLDKVTVFLSLGTSEDALWKKLPSERRNRVRKAQKSGLVATFNGPEALDDFYGVFATNMRDLGSPVHSVGFFREVMTHLPGQTRIVLVRSGDKAIGAGLMLVYKGMISIPWVSSLRPYFALCPNPLLYWETMRFGIAEGHGVLDFGRSSMGSGTYEAKRQWGGETHQLYWHYHPATAEPPGREVQRLSWLTRAWSRLPLPIANTVGPWLRRGISN